MNILVYDGVCPKQYDTGSVKVSPSGGTEATVLRIAEGLVHRRHNVVIEQRHRKESSTDCEGIVYGKLERFGEALKPDVVITLRDAGHYVANKARFPKAKHYLWLHDVVSGEYREHLLAHLMGQEGIHFVVVSEFHKTSTIEALKPLVAEGNVRMTRIYNPVATYATKDPSIMVDENKLVFFSSPHKGLQQVCEMFQMVRRLDPAMKLYVANPGYMPDAEGFPEGVVNLGSLPHEKMVAVIRSALCVFYPNFVFAETFGLVAAEANAVGTPVLTHPLGAMPEVLEHPHQLLDCRNYRGVVDRVLKWKNGERPVVSGRVEFKLENVLKDWIRLFER